MTTKKKTKACGCPSLCAHAGPKATLGFLHCNKQGKCKFKPVNKKTCKPWQKAVALELER